MPGAAYELDLDLCPKEKAYALSEFCARSKAYRQELCTGSNSSLHPECSWTCYPLGDAESYTAGGICVFISVVGLVGNLLTLLAIPYAKKHKRYNSALLWSNRFLNIFIENWRNL